MNLEVFKNVKCESWSVQECKVWVLKCSKILVWIIRDSQFYPMVYLWAHVCALWESNEIVSTEECSVNGQISASLVFRCLPNYFHSNFIMSSFKNWFKSSSSNAPHEIIGIQMWILYDFVDQRHFYTLL